MNLLQMLTQKRTDPLTQFVDRERMIRGNPTRFVGDFLTRAGGGDPNAGILDLVRNPRDMFDRIKSPIEDDEIALMHEGGGHNIQETPEQKEKKKKGQEMMKGMVTDVGDIFAQALQPTPQRQLNFAPLQMGGQSFLIDPAYLQRREDGGPVKKRKPYLVGEDGPEIIVPNEDGMVIPNRRNINWNVETAPTALPQTETVTETVTEPSIADKLRVQIEEYQDPDRYKKGSPRYDKKRNWKDALRSAGYGILQALASAPPNSDTASMIGRAIGGAATGGVMGATMDNVDEKMRDQFKLAQLIPKYKEAYGMERQKKADDLQAENTRADNEINRLRIDIARQNKIDAERGRALSQINRLKKFNPADPTQAALAKAAGLNPSDLKGWDNSSPVLKQVAGQWYKMDSSGTFSPVKELPIDEAKTLRNYTVTDENGVPQTYRISQKDAANFATQMKSLGMKLTQQTRENALTREQQLRLEQLRQDGMKLRQQLTEAERNKRFDEAQRIRKLIAGVVDEADSIQMDGGFIPSP